MRVTLEYENQLKDIEELISNMPNLIEKEEKAMLRKIGKVIQKYVIRQLRALRMTAKEIEGRRNYDRTLPYVQMDDDVKVAVKKSKAGDIYVSVKGGKYTGFKWHFLNDGTRNQDGSVHTAATHFMDKALEQSRGEIDKILSDVARKVANDNG